VVQEESVVLESGPAEESVPEAPKRKALEESPEIQEESTAASIPAEQSEEVDVEPPDETAAPPKLTVLPKKIPTTEPAPTKVVTLKEESKIRPDLPASSVPAAETAPPPRREEEGTDEAVRPPTVTEAEDEPFTPESRPEQVASIDRADEAAADSSVIRPRSEVTAKDSSLYYAQRLAAGSRWLVGGSREKYTVQLMVLSSEDAQQNVRYMLSEESYRPIMDQLYILRKIAQPQTVMLYWGEFDTPAQAREARNRLPSFLSRLEPFEIPVKDAVAKARAGQ
jgi:hypothetical protein